MVSTLEATVRVVFSPRIRRLIENPRYSVQVLTSHGRLEEVLARVSELATAHAVFDLTVTQRPRKLVMLCRKARVIRRSDRVG